MYYNVVWYKVVQSGTLHCIQLHCVDPDIIYNICQCKIQSYWVNTSAGTTFCHKTSLIPELCKAGHVLATVMGMRSHMSKLYSWEVTKITCLLLHSQLLMTCIFMFIPCKTVFENYKYDWFHEVWYWIVSAPMWLWMSAVAMETPETCHRATSS